MLIMELFDKPVEYWADEEDGRPVYKFQVSDTGYQFMYDITMSGNCIDVSFCAIAQNDTSMQLPDIVISYMN